MLNQEVKAISARFEDSSGIRCWSCALVDFWGGEAAKKKPKQFNFDQRAWAKLKCNLPVVLCTNLIWHCRKRRKSEAVLLRFRVWFIWLPRLECFQWGVETSSRCPVNLCCFKQVTCKNESQSGKDHLRCVEIVTSDELTIFVPSANLVLFCVRLLALFRTQCLLVGRSTYFTLFVAFLCGRSFFSTTDHF